MKTLKNVLLVNGLSSGATGVVLLVFADQIATLFTVHNSTPFIAVGIFLVAFATMVFFESRRLAHNVKMVKVIITMDCLWIIASASIVVLQLFNLSPLGYGLIGAVAVWVMLMAYLQFTGVKNIGVEKL
ncbi:hypothetical protein [Chryseolinea sp. H1M3-3]|uniref:hypothetical protein n=1 Tax=Chryseolinea sp. H1M3-3 TaxID=3034144 RepID=UPI0023EA95D7|nr:hypothetical protein [Chryseolinea sp. H1M3-3]